MTMKFCNGCGQPLEYVKFYSVEATCFLPDGRGADMRHLDLCEECYKKIDQSHEKVAVLERAIPWLKKKFSKVYGG